MKLSDLKTGEHAVIMKVRGHGGFRKRIVEMGFVKGQTVEVLLNAPLQDPVEYKVMGYEVSLRRQEAEMIEVSYDIQEDNGVRFGNSAELIENTDSSCVPDPSYHRTLEKVI